LAANTKVEVAMVEKKFRPAIEWISFFVNMFK
jgi:hypothetical protein